jgi:hypothetical protein
MTVLADNNLKQVNREVAEVFGLALASRDNKWPLVFSEKTPTRKDEKLTIIKLDNSVTETTDGGAFTPNNIKEIGNYTITQKIFKDKISLGDFAEEFDNYGKIKQAAMEKGADYAYQMDALAVAFLNNPTSTTAPYGFIVDGSSTKTPLLSATQPIGDTGSTQSNLETGGFSKTNLNDAIVKLVQMKRHNGNIAGYSASRLVCTPTEAMAVWQVLNSVGEPETANRASNYVNTLGIQPIVWDLLTTSTTSFLMGPKAVTPHLIYFVKLRPSMQSIRNQNTGNIEYQYRMMLMAGIADYEGVVGITS